MFTLEYGVGLEMDLYVQVTRGAAVHTGFALARQTDTIAFIHPGGDFDGQGFVLFNAPRAVAGVAGVWNVAAGAMALGASLLDGEKALLHAYLAVACAGGAGFGLRAFFRATTVAGFAFGHGGNADAGLAAMGSIFQCDFEVVAQICAAINVRAAAAATAENIAKNVGESIAKSTATAATGLRIDTRVAVLIVSRALLFVGQYLVSFLGFLELRFGFGIVRIAVRVVLHGQLAVGLFDVFTGSVTIDAQNFVKVAF